MNAMSDTGAHPIRWMMIGAVALLHTVLMGCQSAPTQRRVAVTDFENLLPGEEHAALSASLADWLTATLAKLQTTDSRLSVVGRHELAQAAESGGLFQMFSGDPSDTVNLGRKLDLDYFVMGSVGRLDQTYILNAHLFSVATGEIVPGTAQSKYCTRLEDLYPVMESIGRFMAYQVAERAQPAQ